MVFCFLISFILSGLPSASAVSAASSAAVHSEDAFHLEENSPFSDLADTPFVYSVTILNEAGIINGYPDGTFRPYGSLTRAEAAALIYRAYGSESLALYNTRCYSDVASDMWAASYIDYCSAEGIVNGYPDGTFHPDSQVTYNEIITMILRARNMDSDSMTWPDDYIDAARADGMLDQLSDVSLPVNGNDPSCRGNTSILISCGSEYNTTAASGPSVDYLTDPNMEGQCFGIILSAVTTTDRLEHTCTSGRFLMGSTIYDVLSSPDSPSLMNSCNPVYGLLQLFIKEGKVVSVRQVTEAQSSDSPAGLLTPAAPDSSMTEFCRITSASESAVSYHAAGEESGKILLTDDTVCYELNLVSGKVSASLISASEIQKQDMAAVYSVTGKETADIALIIHPAYTSDLLHASGMDDVMYLG